jgi:hypothetical protein
MWERSYVWLRAACNLQRPGSYGFFFVEPSCRVPAPGGYVESTAGWTIVAVQSWLPPATRKFGGSL